VCVCVCVCSCVCVCMMSRHCSWWCLERLHCIWVRFFSTQRLIRQIVCQEVDHVPTQVNVNPPAQGALDQALACWDCLPPLSSTVRTTRHHARVCDPTPRVFECQRRMSITVQHSAVKSMSHNAAVPCTQPNQRPQTNTKHLYINNHNSHLHRGLVHGFELFHVCLGNAPFHKFLG